MPFGPVTNQFSWFKTGGGMPTMSFTPARGFSMSMVPTSFGPGVLGNQEPRMPSGMGIQYARNNTGGMDYSIPRPMVGIPQPPRPATYPVSQPGAALTQTARTVPVTAPMGAAPAPAMGTPARTPATPTTPATAPKAISPWIAPPLGSTGGVNPTSGANWMGDLLSQIGGQSAATAPPLPDLGIEDQGIQNLMAYNAYMQNQANAENQKYWNYGLNAMQSQGQSAKASNAENAAAQNADNEQMLMSRGLYNSTIPANLAGGVNRDRMRADNQVDENNAQMLMNWLNNRQMQGPDQSVFAQLLAQALNKPDPNLAAGNLPPNAPLVTTAANPNGMGALVPGMPGSPGMPGTQAPVTPTKYVRPARTTSVLPKVYSGMAQRAF